jgi:phospholipid/cholesterol/gamma-HCH transport system substrate-binding protein
VCELIKQTPSIGRIVAMAVFTLSCFALVMFLWLAFGGSIPLRPEGYRVQVAFPEAATLAAEADVRISGVNVGKVKTKALDEGARRTIAELELDERFSPIPRDSRAILRQKTLLGETYVELSTGNKSSGMLEDGERLPDAQVEETTELDEIFGAFDEPTRTAFQQWVEGLAKASRGSAAQDLNDAFGNFDPFATDGAELLRVLDQQKVAVHELIRNTGRVFGAINEREGALRQLIVNSNNTFEATASRDEALAETFEIFPTFLDESKATLARLERFSRDTRPLVNDLKAPADDLGPTVRDLGDLAPHLENLFRDLPPLIRASRRSVPALKRVLQGVEPVLEELHPFFQELNPILSYFNFHQATLAGFISNAAPDLSGDFGGDRYQVNVGITESTSFTRHRVRPDSERGNAYMQPNALQRAIALGTIESFDCAPSGGERPDAEDAENANPLQKESLKRPPCLVAPPSLYHGKQFGRLERGQAPNRSTPGFREGTEPAVDPNPGDPLN